jgi:hypothetical protein
MTTDRTVGYIMLIVGIILLLIPSIMSLLIVSGAVGPPIYVPAPTVNETDPAAALARVVADAFVLFNIAATFLLFVVLVYAASVLIGKGVGLIKEIGWVVQRAPETRTQPSRKEEEE